MTGLQLIKDFFATPARPLTMQELKALSAAEREELADAVASQRGLKKEKKQDGTCEYK